MSAAPRSDEQSITITRIIGAPGAEVFAAWLDPALMKQWLVPMFCKIIELDADARPGGSFRVVIRGPLGGRHVISGEYREVTPNTRLVQTWVLEGYSKTIDRYPTLLTIDFRELGPRATEVTLRQDQLRTRADRSGNLMGWRMCLTKLEKVLKSRLALTV